MFFKKATGPKDGDFVNYVEELQKNHSKINPDADQEAKPLTAPLEQCVDKIKADHENAIQKLREENRFNNDSAYKDEKTPQDEATLHPEDIPLEKGGSAGLYETPEGPTQWPKKTQTKSRSFNKKNSIPIIICFVIFSAIAAITKMPIYIIPLFVLIFLLGIINNVKRSNRKK